MANRKKVPGLFSGWKGVFYRGAVDDTPPDHLVDALNLSFAPNGDMQSREGLTSYFFAPNIIRMALFKPLPPFTSTNFPREIFLKNDGSLWDIQYPSQPLVGVNAIWKDFNLVNFFGRCYITPSDGRVGVQGELVYVYDGTGSSGFRRAAGAAPTQALTANLIYGGTLVPGTYLLSYAFETASGFITAPAPFIALDSNGGRQFNITNLPLGPAGTKARWLVTCKAIPFRANLNIPFDATTANLYPQFLAQRIGDNTTTTGVVLNFYDANLVNSADSLFANLAQIPAGVGLIDYKGRMVSYGEYSNPSLVRVSEIGNPEQFSSTSGFIITDPTDSTGVRSATEFRDLLYIFKQQRGIVVQDNGQEASTWVPINFEKAIGTEQYGIAALLDAKGATSEGFFIADRSGIIFFNGTFQEPELTYKVIDLWKRINYTKFYTVQMAVDPINKRLYVLIPLDAAVVPSHLLVGDFRDGLDPSNIKWCLWRFDPTPANNPNSILVYNDFRAGDPTLATRLSSLTQISTLNIGKWSGQTDGGTSIAHFAEFPPIRLMPTGGVSIFNNVNLRVYGKGSINMIAYTMDKKQSFNLRDLLIGDELPGREYSIPFNLVSEQCRFYIQSNSLNAYFACNSVLIEGKPFWKMRPR